MATKFNCNKTEMTVEDIRICSGDLYIIPMHCGDVYLLPEIYDKERQEVEVRSTNLLFDVQEIS